MAKTITADRTSPAICPACRTSLEFRPCRCNVAYLEAVARATVNHENRLEEMRTEQASQLRKVSSGKPQSAATHEGTDDYRAKTCLTGARPLAGIVPLVLLALGMLGASATKGLAGNVHHEARGFDLNPARAFSSLFGNCFSLQSGRIESIYSSAKTAETPILQVSSWTFHSSGKESFPVPSGPENILAYILRMETLCQRLHRHDLAAEYREAWETAALAIYGPLPPRSEVQPTIPAQTEKPVPRWRQEKFAKPLRRVIAIFGDYEVLECGHRIWRPVELADEPQAKHRRCKECVQVEAQKKAPQKSKTATEEKQA